MYSTPTEASIVIQVKKYFEDIQSCPIEEDSLRFWLGNKNKYLNLHAFALKLLSVTAPSAPVERLLSAGRILRRPYRASLGSNMLFSFIFPKCSDKIM